MVAPADQPLRVLHYQAALVRDREGFTARCLELGWLWTHGRNLDEAWRASVTSCRWNWPTARTIRGRCSPPSCRSTCRCPPSSADQAPPEGRACRRQVGLESLRSCATLPGPPGASSAVRGRRLGPGGGGDQLGQRLLDAGVEVIADGADLLDGLAGEVLEPPALLAFAEVDRQASPQPMVTTTSAAWTKPSVRGSGNSRVDAPSIAAMVAQPCQGWLGDLAPGRSAAMSSARAFTARPAVVPVGAGSSGTDRSACPRAGRQEGPQAEPQVAARPRSLRPACPEHRRPIDQPVPVSSARPVNG
jgi:hypothetical protein